MIELWSPIFKKEQVWILSDFSPSVKNLVFRMDFEWRGKVLRQVNFKRESLVFSDIKKFKKIAGGNLKAIRVNPISYPETLKEIDFAINTGYEYIILPYFKTLQEVELFLSLLEGSKVKPILLVETKEAFFQLDELVKYNVWAYHLGLTDLSLDLKKEFLLDLYFDGTVEKFVKTMKNYNKRFGIGGVAPVDRGIIPGREILKILIELGANQVFLSSDFYKLLESDPKLYFFELERVLNLEKELKMP